MQIKDENSKGWALSLGFYPGLLLGFRTYSQPDMLTHVLYMPFVDLALEIDL